MNTEVGKHYWAKIEDKLMVVLAFDEESFYVCGAWENPVYPEDGLVILGECERPEYTEGMGLYYL